MEKVVSVVNYSQQWQKIKRLIYEKCFTKERMLSV